MLAYLDTLIGFAIVMLGISLLITILTQMVSALLSHRGANLKWGLVTLFRHIPGCPLLNNDDHAEMIARDILSHPLISDSIFSLKLPVIIPKRLARRFQLATAIDPDELVAILKDLATQKKYTEIAGLPGEIARLIDARNPAVERRLELLARTFAPAGVALQNAVPLLHDTLDEMKSGAGQLEAWFNATMERASSRFATYARLWTVAFAMAFAFATGLNSVALLSALYTNGDFRQQMVGAGTQIGSVAEGVLPQAPPDVAAGLFTGLVQQALTSAKVQSDLPSGIDSEAAARQWIAAHVSDAAQQSAVLTRFEKAYLTERSQDAAAIRNVLTKSSFDVLQFRWDPRKPVWPQIPGVLATAALLSLGAPFWFNLLKQASNLRPILAEKQDQK